MKNSLNKTARWSALVVTMGVMSLVSAQSQAAINWPGGTGDPNKKSKNYKKGYKQGQQDCVKNPKDCRVLLEDVVANPGWGETEPNDHMAVADRLKLNRFYKGNSLDRFDQDWYYVGTTKPNQNLIINFLGDQVDYTTTDGWIVEVRDRNGNVIASFDSTTSGGGNVYRNGDNEEDAVDPSEPILAKTPLSNAKIMLTTLGNAGRYYISVKSNDDAGTQRAYHISAMISESDQISPNPDTNFFDTETEINDTQEMADPLRSNVHMFGTFGRKMVKWFVPPEDNVEWVYPGCDPADIQSILDHAPPGQGDCSCDVENTPAGTCVAIPKNDGGGAWEYAYDYDNDWFEYRSEGNEQLHFEMCAKGSCDFARVHLRIIYVNDSVVLINGPIQPGWSYDFGVTGPGTYFIELSPEPVDGPQVDPDTGVHTVDDLTGPYNFLLRSTKLPPHGN
ncbi:hypothetical protein [Thiolapillus sp.]